MRGKWKRPGRGIRALKIGGLALVMLIGLAGPPLVTEAAPAGSAPSAAIGRSGMPTPRFVSLKAARVNVRIGPGEDYQIAWVFTRAGLPVEVIQEFDNWRRIRDSDGTTGWIFHSLLAGKRTVVVAPWAKPGAVQVASTEATPAERGGEPRPIRASASGSAEIIAYLEPGVTGDVDRCNGGWCNISGEGYSGWITQDQLWGVYANEEID
jgi:SH3-like domain-containing protein